MLALYCVENHKKQFAYYAHIECIAQMDGYLRYSHIEDRSFKIFTCDIKSLTLHGDFKCIVDDKIKNAFNFEFACS